MATSDQLKALLKSHLDGDEDRFYSIAMQIAATEARSGHGKLAQELKSMRTFSGGCVYPEGIKIHDR